MMLKDFEGSQFSYDEEKKMVFEILVYLPFSHLMWQLV
jgi:hypothetical protein